MSEKKQIFLDHNSTTPVLPEVVAALLPYLSENFGNPSSSHFFGRESKVALEEAREKVAMFLNASPAEICFTGCGSESDNLAIKGIAWAKRDKGNHIVTSTIEHPAVLESCRWLEKNGFEVTYLATDRFGLVDPDDLKKAVRGDTILISIMHANNEIGTIQPIVELSKIARQNGVCFHTDAVQSAGKLKLDVKELGVDLLSISGHKLYAPKGVGALYIKQGTKIEVFLHGGNQERGKRSGTENVPYIVGLGKACEIADRDLSRIQKQMTELGERFYTQVQKTIPDVNLNGHPERRLSNTFNLCFAGCEAQSVIMALDLKGVAVASGAACHSGVVKPSGVLSAIGLTSEEALSSVRFSFGMSNTVEDVDYICSILSETVKKTRGSKHTYAVE